MFQILTIILSLVAVGVALFVGPAAAWFIIGLADAFIVVTFWAAKTRYRFGHVPELSAEANAMLQRYGHYFAMPSASRDFSASAATLRFAGVYLAIITSIRGSWWFLLLGAINWFFMGAVASRLSPAERSVLDPAARAAHDEIFTWLYRRQTDPSIEIEPQRLRVSVERLDLGTLALGQGAVAEFEVEGGPGQIVAESDQVQVTPQRFEEGTTRVRVEVRPMPRGALWTTLRLVTAGETLEVPVVARWGEAAPEGALVVAPDGSGDARGLEVVVQQAPPGATLYLEAGIHRVSRPLYLDKPLSLVGEGMDVTFVTGECATAMLTFSGKERLTLSELTLRLEGGWVGDVIRCSRGKIILRRCRIEGAQKGKNSGGAGLRVSGRGRCEIQECVFERNEYAGLVVVSEGEFSVEQSSFMANGHGIALGWSASGVVRHNTCSGNEHYGIYVDQWAQPILESNTCRGNKLSGIAYFGSASGAARHNICSGNGKHGIYVGGHAKPALENNTCQWNKESGIAYFGSASGAARYNTCRGNRLHGIGVDEQSQPTLENNTCQRNKYNGIAYFGRASGAARHNTCSGNGGDGIYVGVEAKPTLERNTCQGNKYNGIAYCGSASGAVGRNMCSGNEKHGIYVGRGARPLLEKNTCQGNKEADITYRLL
jgi:parallel beta-helix repeat protein